MRQYVVSAVAGGAVVSHGNGLPEIIAHDKDAHRKMQKDSTKTPLTLQNL